MTGLNFKELMNKFGENDVTDLDVYMKGYQAGIECDVAFSIEELKNVLPDETLDENYRMGYRDGVNLVMEEFLKDMTLAG